MPQIPKRHTRGQLIMNRLRSFAVIALIAGLSAAAVQPQEGTNTTYFERAGVQFELPAGWNVNESNLLGEQIVTIQPEGGSAQIAVSTIIVSSCDFQAEARKTMAALVERVARQIHSAAPTKFSVTNTEVNGEEIAGVGLRGVADNKAVTADVYSFRVGLRIVSLVYIRVANDEAASAAWNAVRTTLKANLTPKAFGVVAERRATDVGPGGPRPIISGGVLNGKAISLPVPSYPPIARQAHASGTVVVQVTIDETGAIISAHAVRGHPLLQAVCVQAARAARFLPTKLCAEPVKVTGIITYNFVAE
jgi:TonB family protein